MSFSLNLHEKQLEVFKDKARFKLLISGRRFGKSRLLLTSAIFAALSFDQPIDPASPPVCLIVMPTLKSCRSIHWEPLLNLLAGQPFVASISKSDFRIKLKGSKPDILIRGADNDGDSLRGLKLAWVGVDEFQDFSFQAWEKVLYPALADTPNSKALLIGTPKGRSHFLHKFHLQVKANPEWSYFHFVTRDNPFVPRSFLRQAKTQMPMKTYRQEFQASFEDFDGQLFDQLSEKHLIKDIPSDLSYYLGSDWGDTHPAIAVVGVSKDLSKFYLVDAWTNKTEAPIVQDEFINKMASFCTKYNVYKAFLPDDRPASVIAARLLGKEKDIAGLKRAVQVSRGNLGVMPSIKIINNLFFQENLFIKSSLTEVVSQFQDYHRAVDSQGLLLNHPADHQADHIIDSFRYACVSIYNTIQSKKR
nr:hypothetical protein [Nostoc sp. ChiSLP03a]MDZ8215800.1 hypothetical protein [Nostoc sp. ChiSLP03a]